MEIEFFEQSTRTAEERIKLCKTLTPDMFSDDYLYFGYDYFDNEDYFVGYQGYHYDGRYYKTAKKIARYYGLGKGEKVLELGCAKGFLLVEFLNLGMDVYGVDANSYPVDNCHPDLVGKIRMGRLPDMEFEDRFFDLIISKEVLPHMEMGELINVLEMTERISKGNIFHEIQCGRTDEELLLMKKWDQTHKTILSPDDWLKLFKDNDYVCDYHFKVLMPIKELK